MKQTIKSARKITMGIFAICLMGVYSPTFATPLRNNPAELTYIGKQNDQPVFQLKINSPEAETYFINVKDANNNVLYSEKLNGANITRNYRLDVNDYELNSPDFGVTVEVISAKTHKKEVYKISNETKVTSDIVVAKL
jgi:hypothetical protein